MKESIFHAMEGVMKLCKGGYAALYLINGVGLVSFRDPHGIRPLVFGHRQASSGGDRKDYAIASESVAIDTLGFDLVRDVKPGEAIFIDMHSGECHNRICHPSPSYSPCIFEYVYFARPDSIMDGVSVYKSRLHMGEKLAKKIQRVYPDHGIDVVIPIPDTSRTSALQAAYQLNRPFREGFIKNRYIARTFIMPGQAARKKSVRLKLNTIKSEFAGKNVLLVDDSIVRGTTGHEIVQMARDAGALKVFFCSAAPPIRFPNIYGIDIPTREELIAYNRNPTQIAKLMGCDWIVYQDLEDMQDAVRELTPPENRLDVFDTSCFSGNYVTGEAIGDEYFTKLYAKRNEAAKKEENGPREGGGEGCEGMSNDTRSSKNANSACESIANQPQKK